jgi:glycosyltransferase involved in cell wall biosynthesis
VEAAQTPERLFRNRLGYFGQFNPYKGVKVLLEAMELLSNDDEADSGELGSGLVDAVDVHLKLHGANLEWQSEDFQTEFRSLTEANAATVTLVGGYDEEELPRLMQEVDWVIAPSTWWENSPLVIQEAFQYGRPVICSGIGALAEKVTHGVNGLHFRVGDPDSLAETIKMAVTSPGLWEMLREGIPRVRTTSEDVETLIDVYQQLVASRMVA